MRLETPFILGLAKSASALWLVTYYTTTDCSGAGKKVGGFEAGCCTLENDTESDMVSKDSGKNISLSTGSTYIPRYEDSILSGVIDRCLNAAIRSFLSY
ncbi:hypothetical protein N7517_008126 [Penicillium concentricum]|uniref:Uncharacterized protein n=1 Tax=Penicillium concentricum TaxID=293559 RepID=A0A9W9RRU7_9EURO|nr:uncharacterized protein N7517_008126 [Penicillium concentricum]KAJ5365240.1 hypothetical protein N7517_008126 [Penicillium concentricum]